MPNKFYNILVPIDFTARNKWAIAKAIEIANNFDCNIHFVNIVNNSIIPGVPLGSSLITPYESYSDRMYHYEKLKQLAAVYSNQLCGAGKIEISVLEGEQAKKLSEYITDFTMDLVVTGLSRFNLLERIISSISISRLAKRTNVPVLAVNANGLVCHFKKIILPLHDDISLHKVKLATMLARTFRSTIYMITLRTENNAAEKLISDALELVQSISAIPVQGIILEGRNLAKTTLDFAKKINGDLIMINPLKEFHLPGWWNTLTKKLLTYGSKVPVITMTSNKE